MIFKLPRKGILVGQGQWVQKTVAFLDKATLGMALSCSNIRGGLKQQMSITFVIREFTTKMSK